MALPDRKPRCEGRYCGFAGAADRRLRLRSHAPAACALVDFLHGHAQRVVGLCSWRRLACVGIFLAHRPARAEVSRVTVALLATFAADPSRRNCTRVAAPTR